MNSTTGGTSASQAAPGSALSRVTAVSPRLVFMNAAAALTPNTPMMSRRPIDPPVSAIAALMSMSATNNAARAPAMAPSQPPAPTPDAPAIHLKMTMAIVVCSANWARLNAIFRGGWRRVVVSTRRFPMSWPATRSIGDAKNRPTTSGISLIENE